MIVVLLCPGNNINFEGLPTGIGKLYNLVSNLLTLLYLNIHIILTVYSMKFFFNIKTLFHVLQMLSFNTHFGFSCCRKFSWLHAINWNVSQRDYAGLLFFEIKKLSPNSPTIENNYW